MSDEGQGPQRPRVPSQRPQAKRPQQQAEGQPARRPQRPAAQGQPAQRQATPGQPARKPQARPTGQAPARRRPATGKVAQAQRPQGAAPKLPSRPNAPAMRPYGTTQGPSEPFRPIQGVGKAAVALLSIGAALSLVTAVVAVMYIGEINAVEQVVNEGGDLEAIMDAAASATELEELSVILIFPYIGIRIAAAILFMIFLFRASKNLDFFRAPQRKWKPGWAIGGWFIPIGNLFIPGSVTKEIWRFSAPKNKPSKQWLVMAWWIPFAIAMVGDRVSSRIDGEELSDLKRASYATLGTEFFVIIAAIFGIMMILNLSKIQHERANHRHRQMEEAEEA